MPTSNPRIHVVLEKSLYKKVERMAKKDGVSLSLKVRDLIRDFLQNYEDLQLLRTAQLRSKSFSRSGALSHQDVWRHLKREK